MSVYSPPDPQHALTPTGNLVRRMWISRAFEVLARLAAAIAVAVLLLVVVVITVKGIGAWFTHDFFGGPLVQASGIGGGLGPAFVGSIELVALTIAIAAPLSVLIAIYTVEFAPPAIASAIRSIADVMNGIPTIVTGVFIFAIMVQTDALGNHEAGYKAAIALAIVVTPLITRSSMESLSRVPSQLREAADALGVARWRTLLGVVLPTAFPSIVTATILAAARAAGETAPVLFIDSAYTSLNFQFNPAHTIANVPVMIYSLLQGGPGGLPDAWGAALMLMVIILSANIISRVLLIRAERKRGL